MQILEKIICHFIKILSRVTWEVGGREASRNGYLNVNNLIHLQNFLEFPGISKLNWWGRKEEAGREQLCSFSSKMSNIRVFPGWLNSFVLKIMRMCFPSILGMNISYFVSWRIGRKLELLRHMSSVETGIQHEKMAQISCEGWTQQCCPCSNLCHTIEEN